jgi:dihydropteroate synthase
MGPVSVLAGLPVGGDHPVRVMAAINVSPESFFAGSVQVDEGALRAAAQQAVEDGADIIDIGAKSTAPYLDTAIPLDEEVRRMGRAVQVVAGAVQVPISADSTRAAVVAAALASGARIVNDVSGLRGDAAMADIAAQADGVVLMASPDGESGAPPIALVRRMLSDSLERAPRRVARTEIVPIPASAFTRSGVPYAAFTCAVLDGRRARRPRLPAVGRRLRQSSIGQLTGRSHRPAGRVARRGCDRRLQRRRDCPHPRRCGDARCCAGRAGDQAGARRPGHGVKRRRFFLCLRSGDSLIAREHALQAPVR